MIISELSHLDHGLTADHVRHLLALFGDRNEFFIETIDLPVDIDPVQCHLHGPATDEAPVLDSDVTYEKRGNRTGRSRMCSRPPTMTRTLTVIAGPIGADRCVLYTAYGGPIAPREPWDPNLPADKVDESRSFWAEHALSAGE